MVPVLSVVVLSYNSAATVVETLESVFAQTFPDIELIVADDASSDATVSLTRQWLDSHGKRFSSYSLVTADSNSGIAVNLARGVEASSGEFLKIIAADDILKPEAAAGALKFMKRGGIDICMSDVEVFSAGTQVPQAMVDAYRRYFNNVKEPAEMKLRRFSYEYALPTPAAFYTRRLYDKVGGMDLRYPMWDELPFYVKVVRAGYDIKALDEKLVGYRYSGSSLSQNGAQKLYNRAYFKDYRRAFYHIQLPLLLRYGNIGKLLGKMIRVEVYNLRYKTGGCPRAIVSLFDALKMQKY